MLFQLNAIDASFSYIKDHCKPCQRPTVAFLFHWQNLRCFFHPCLQTWQTRPCYLYNAWGLNDDMFWRLLTGCQNWLNVLFNMDNVHRSNCCPIAHGIYVFYTEWWFIFIPFLKIFFWIIIFCVFLWNLFDLLIVNQFPGSISDLKDIFNQFFSSNVDTIGKSSGV